MAKSVRAKAVKKTGSKKMKRSVRRTLGALCMISAITVAAIPVPDVEAYDPSQAAYAVVPYNNITIQSKSVPYSDTTIPTEAAKDNLKMPTSGLTKDGITYSLSVNGGVTYLDRQFDYKSNDNYANAYITGYNEKMLSDSIDLSSNMLFSDYVYIEPDSFTDLTVEGNPDPTNPLPKKISVKVHLGEDPSLVAAAVDRLGYQYTLSGDPALMSQTSEEKKFYSNYFPDVLKKYEDDYQEYNDKVADTTAAGGDPTTIPQPPAIIMSLLDHPDYDSYDEQKSYLCNQIFGNGATYGITLEPTMMYVYDDAGNQTSTKQIYLFKANNISPVSQIDVSNNWGHFFYVDNQGFMVMKFIHLVGIKEGALQGIDRINELILGNDITNICDRAFYGSTMLRSVKFGLGTKIGNQVFCNSANLDTVDLTGVTDIGMEAFAHTKVKSMSVPESVSVINEGAFYDCKLLDSVTFEGVGTNPTSVLTAAFCDDAALRTVDFGDRMVDKVGDYAFALTDTSLFNKDGLTDFVYSRFITKVADLGEFALANRKRLQRVTLSSGLEATAAPEKVPETLVAGCSNLEYFRFPVETAGVDYEPTMFYDVINPNFYVWGPEKFAGDYAKPRINTWTARMNVAANSLNGGDPVTYKYFKDDNESNPPTYEVSNGKLIQGIDATGQLVNCSYVPGTTPDQKKTDLIIDESVASIKINSIASGCFDQDVRENVTGIVIADGNLISDIGDGVFKDFDSVTYVNLGNGVRTIGNSAFEGCDNLAKATIGENIESIGSAAFRSCPNLVDIYFDSPGDVSNPALTLNSIGEQAFQTGSTQLTFHGEISPVYGPFAYAMADSTFANAQTGCRVCYKTPLPSGFTVLLDNRNGYPTLVDVPHYEDIKYYHDLYATDIALPGNDVLYGNGDGKYSDYKTYYDLYNDLQNNAALNPDEQKALNAISNIVIPEGIKSIDVKGYINNSSNNPDGYQSLYDNKVNTTTYLKNGPNGLTDPYYSDYQDYGLFDGYAATDGSSARRDYPDNDLREDIDMGNDRITYVEMADVRYLPDKAFDSCEQLQTVILGDDLTEPGVLPFYRCPNLVQAQGNDTVFSENGILYKVNGVDANGNKSYTLVECFASRGGAVGSNMVSTKYDPNFANVSEIEEGAFSSCPTLRFVDFDGVNQLTTIPKDCFKDSNSIRNIDLPENIDTIESGAFDVSSDIEVIARNPDDVYLDSDAFGNFLGRNQPYYVTYENNKSRRLAQKKGVNVDRTLPDVVRVTFLCGRDGTVLAIQTVETGKHPDGLDEEDLAIHEGDLHVHEGYEFKYWAINGVNYTKLTKLPVTEDITLTAVYEPIGGGSGSTTPGVTNAVVNPTQAATTNAAATNAAATSGVNNNGNKTTTPSASETKYKLTVVYGNGSGQYPKNTTVIIEAIDPPAGKVFDKWVVTGASASIYSSTSKATTITTVAGETVVTATYKDASNVTTSSGNKGTAGSSTGTYSRTGVGATPVPGTTAANGTRVDITRPGVSDVDKAYASVSGSTDSFVVKITESADAANQVATALANKYGDMTPIKYFAMDISLYDATGTNKITDTSNLRVNVTMPIPDALRQYAGNNKIGVVVNGVQLEDLACKFVTVDGVPCVSFTATHFSPYTIYVDTNNLTVGTIDGSPKTGDPIHPKWFVTIALAALSLILFLKRDKVTIPKTA